jgi:polyhydroxyalkanoate synthesis regulator phasin
MKTHPASIPSHQERKDFQAKLIATPGLAQAYIAVTQKVYDKQVKSGKLNPEQAREAKKLLKQFHGELTGFIVRQALTKVTLRLLKMQKKERLNKRDEEDLLGCTEDITHVEKQLKGTLKDEREELSHFWRRAVVETCLQSERIVVQTHGKAQARELFGSQLPSEFFTESKSGKRKTTSARLATSRTSTLPGSQSRKRAVKTSCRV